MDYELMTHDEQVAELNSILADVAILTLKNKDKSKRITIGEINRMKGQLALIPKLKKACNHYPEIKNAIVIKAKNLMLDIIS